MQHSLDKDSSSGAERKTVLAFLDEPTVLAPMEGVGHPEFRSAIASMGGLGLVCTEFVRVSRAPLNAASLQKAVVKAAGLPLSVQVMGNDADKMAEAAYYISEAGADVVDINMGCPMPRVVRKGVGAAMLKDPELLKRVLGAMRERTPGLLSAKIRAGWDNAEEVLTIASVVENSGVDFIAVHPRRRCDFYEGVSDWRIIKALVGHLNIPVIGNGDVWYARDALRMREETGCHAVMLGRPAIRNPWICRQISQLRAGRDVFRPSGMDLVNYVIESNETNQQFRHPLGRLKELIRWVGRAQNDADFVRGLLRVNDADELLAKFAERIGPLSAIELDLGPNGEHGLERSGSAVNSEQAA